ncbi:C6 finger domain transcription factor nosA [Penicillium taxi]|uniref:C6 finger domain transcription factor nosA n=1 Tax=Penicillium taxi TaxID=168475 RepID=UPI00254546AD|nr:C6 finger domain transcription factor nosA [Penicillium taxi]KAJ5895057.1 C6 finger domain transcription factor nosA [Penicillium taxi]
MSTSTKTNYMPASMSRVTKSSTSSDCSTTQVHASGDRTNNRAHKRSRSGCYTCRLRRKKCDEKRGKCGACVNLSVTCEYNRPAWWGNAEQRRIQKERIKNKIKQTKSLERSGNSSDRYRRSNPCLPSPSRSPSYDSNPTNHIGVFDMTDPYSATYQQGHWVVQEDRREFVGDVQMSHITSTSTFNTFNPDVCGPQAPYFEFPPEQKTYSIPYNYFTGEPEAFIDPYLSADPTPYYFQDDQSEEQRLLMNIPVEEKDRPLLDYFATNVMHQIFPVLGAHPQGHVHSQNMLQSMASSLTYLHTCLCRAAVHLKVTQGLSGPEIDTDIIQHRLAALRDLFDSVQVVNDTQDKDEYKKVLDGSLAMLLYHCSLGSSDEVILPCGDQLKVIRDIVREMHLYENPFEYVNGIHSMALAAWVDILGATMTGGRPEFSDTYRNHHLSGKPLGLQELMGCDDRIIYLISEIACLESLKNDGTVDSMTLHSHVEALEAQLQYTEPENPTLEHPYSPKTGEICPQILTKIISSIFRTAARIYLCSLLPGYDRHQKSVQDLVQKINDDLEYIPYGPQGFDRSLVWPLLMAGVNSSQGSQFRVTLSHRRGIMGDHIDLGGFGRLCRLLDEVWRLSDSPCYKKGTRNEDYSSSLTSPISKLDRSDPFSLTGTGATLGGREIKRQEVHWRKVMEKKEWNFVLI